MNKTVRDIVLDVRVSVPYAEPVPTFEVGKSYRTRKGDVVKIVRRIPNPTYPLQGEYHNQSWTLDGRYWKEAKGEVSADLMPGAIEDEPTNRNPEESPHSVAAEGMGYAPKPDVTITDLQQLHNRLNRQAERIEKLTAECENLKPRLTSLELLEEASVTGNRNYAHDEGARRRIGSVEEALTKRLDALETARAWIDTTSVYQRINDVHKRIDALDRAKEVAGAVDRLAKVKPNHPDVVACGDPECGQCYSPKRTIKGGWINVYCHRGRSDTLNGSFVTTYETKEAADAAACDNRFACIQIPDITEGEGL